MRRIWAYRLMLALLLGCATVGMVPLSVAAQSNSGLAMAPPQLLYTDLVSGPNSGGENNKGAYLSIFGRYFGDSGLGSTVKVFINGVEVDNYRYLGASRGRPDIQQITVQVGALGQPKAGVALPIRVVVGNQSSNTDLTFTVNAGRMLFVDNVAGNDGTARADDITRPWRLVQTPALRSGGLWPQVRPGDTIVMRGHGADAPWTDLGFEGYFMRVADRSGKAPTGAAGTGPITVIGYPGEDVLIRGTLAKGMTGGCLSGINGSNFKGMGQWVVIANLRIDCEGYDGPISQEIFGHHWRVVNNDLAASTAPRTGASVPRMAGIVANGNDTFLYGNHIHDIQGSAQECHGIYIDGDGSYDIGFNNIHDIRDGNGFQIYVNGGNGSVVADNVSFHNNLIHDVSKHGINLADNARQNISVWNNIVYNAQLAGVRINSNILTGARVHHNTFYNVNIALHPLYGALVNDWSLQKHAVDVRNNIFMVARGSAYVSGSVGFSSSGATMVRNLWFNGTGKVSLDSAALMADPAFVAPGQHDFRLLDASPARGAALPIPTNLPAVVDDYQARKLNAPPDLGALKF